MRQLDVFMGDALIGYLREREDGSMAFAYDDQWLGAADAAALSPELPLGAREPDAMTRRLKRRPAACIPRDDHRKPCDH